MQHFLEPLPAFPAAEAELSENDLVLDLLTEGRFWRTSKLKGLFLLYRGDRGLVEEVFLPEKETDEYDLLVEAAPRLEGPGALITYNGDSFDLPHPRKKYEAYRLPVPFSRRTSVDLFQKLRPLQGILGLPSRKLADLAEYLANALPPKDFYTNDARHAFAALSLLPVLRFLEGAFAVDELHAENETLILRLRPSDPLPIPLTLQSEGICLSANAGTATLPPPENGESICLSAKIDSATLQLPLSNGFVRNYFPDYKNYEYLPIEGYAIHKSVAAYVAADRREPATPNTAFALVPANKLLTDAKAAKLVAKNAISAILASPLASP